VSRCFFSETISDECPVAGMLGLLVGVLEDVRLAGGLENVSARVRRDYVMVERWAKKMWRDAPQLGMSEQSGVGVLQLQRESSGGVAR
jgi:hypothetical protein